MTLTNNTNIILIARDIRAHLPLMPHTLRLIANVPVQLSVALTKRTSRGFYFLEPQIHLHLSTHHHTRLAPYHAAWKRITSNAWVLTSSPLAVQSNLTLWHLKGPS